MPVAHLYPGSPYNFSLTAAIFAGGDRQIRTYENNLFWQALDIGGNPVLVKVFSEGSVESPGLHLSVLSENPISKSRMEDIQNLVASMLSIYDNIIPFYEAMERDVILTSLISRLRGLKIPVTPTVFEALIDSVIEQQISLKAAHSVEKRLIKATGASLTIDGDTWYCYPTPYSLAQTPDSLFRACGLTHRKGEYIREISHQILTGSLELEHFRSYPDTESIISEMVTIRGVGRWTAELTILRGLHRADAFPADDVGVRRFISQVYHDGGKISPNEARSFAERWGEWKGWAAFYLEVADLLRVRAEE